MQLGPLEVGFVVAVVLACYAGLRGVEVVEAVRDAALAFCAGLRGRGATPAL